MGREYFDLNTEKLRLALADMLCMNGSREYLTEEFVDLIVYELVYDLGLKLPELRPGILKKYPQVACGMDLLRIGWWCDDHPHATEEEAEAFFKSLESHDDINKRTH